MVHDPGQLDFSIAEKEFPVTVYRRKISSIWEFIETPGHVAIITRRGKRECALVSIETCACMSDDYDAEMERVEEANREYQAKRRAVRRVKNGTTDM